ncbi:unnamed protein product [Meganyctiphanes norvegica]|uniref:EF-hand domain-containing protein n=1 Tax=Meganyctiphanes norvegica TaxID=48144 RepID=A0AAV2QZW0_MEGNR
MDRGRSTSISGGSTWTLVAGVKSVFRSRSRSQSTSATERSKSCEMPKDQPRPRCRTPKSPFLWRRNKGIKDKSKEGSTATLPVKCSGSIPTLNQWPSDAVQRRIHDYETIAPTSLRDYETIAPELRERLVGKCEPICKDNVYSNGPIRSEQSIDNFKTDNIDNIQHPTKNVHQPVIYSSVNKNRNNRNNVDSRTLKNNKPKDSYENFMESILENNKSHSSSFDSDGTESHSSEHYADDVNTVKSPRHNTLLYGALKYNLEVPLHPKNEVVVLALGVDHYIEEVFKHLDTGRTGKILIDEFRALCSVLDIESLQNNKKEKLTRIRKCTCQGSILTLNGTLEESQSNATETNNLQCELHLSFSEFHDMLCQQFVKSSQGEMSKAISPLSTRRENNEKLVEAVVSVQRRYDIIEAITKSLSEVTKGLAGQEKTVKTKNCENCQYPVTIVDRNCNSSSSSMKENTSHAKHQILLQQQELQCLREVIDDLRVALMSSDAENLALQVKSKTSKKALSIDNLHELSLTDEEDTIDDLVRQLNELSHPSEGSSTSSVNEIGPNKSSTLKRKKSKVSSNKKHFCKCVPNAGEEEKQQLSIEISHSVIETKDINEKEEKHNTAFIYKDFPGEMSLDANKNENQLEDDGQIRNSELSLEDELQATYEALQVAREAQEATQADLQNLVDQYQQCQADLRATELNLRASQAAHEKAEATKSALVSDATETARQLHEMWAQLRQLQLEILHSRDLMQEKEDLLNQANNRIQSLQSSKNKVVVGVSSARTLVAGSLEHVREGEHALVVMAQDHHHHHDHDLSHDNLSQTSSSTPNSNHRSDVVCRADSGLYSDDSERDDDLKTSDRSTDRISGSEEDLWSPRERSSNSSSEIKSSDGHLSDSNSTHVLKEESVLSQKISREEGCSQSEKVLNSLERQMRWLQLTLDQAEKDWDEKRWSQTSDTIAAWCENGTSAPASAALEAELRHVETERVRLGGIEAKLRHLLQGLITIADLNMSRRTVGRLLLEAVESACGDQVTAAAEVHLQEVNPLQHISTLLTSTSHCDNISTSSLLHLALKGLTKPPADPRVAIS